MRTIYLTSILLVSMIPAANASPIENCKAASDNALCQIYLKGVVEGALMYKPLAVGARLESNDYQSRALKYRGGKRFQEANRQFCLERLPDPEQLVTGLTEAFDSGEVTDSASLQVAVFSLLDCQRLQ
ncbi:MAG: hypothetical protein PWP74_1796 [Shewanella sp.]|uniref:hypothetical protein n=1 Tax=Shewanella fodinae TaxID=552357 RepID=UPI00167AAB51|nr:hypothetical protein [Shewanella fodinae]MCL2906627.1 hypothetical protein [Shewanella fodinae]MDN5370488.1 hypothetical protein [Shewanella sp.]GGZ01567.1 hypothetical protein GCM10007169_17970 [Shewanella fodinae]